ncbi:outer membrane immunogenic protein [Stakelama sediminis]|uniref:Outer membrane immunogenic protein n=1 Tax=Stakelama sediminis TaxID=463200 RepID=A0A840YZZ9_9SPHN|nr:outer membrane beta-barrel protein [Stakelama sediminis]MBB5719066.1 outer membrane immunogenic protein [Stakelama sediminis]
MRMLALTALGAVVVATPAFAQTGPQVPFNGPRVGVVAGYDGISPGSSQDSNIDGTDRTASGLLYGVDAGYDVNLGHAVIGVDGEVDGSTAKVNPYDGSDNYFGYGRVKAGRDLYIGARAGILATPTTLIYAKGGYTNARLDVTATDGTLADGRHFNLDGFRVGAGVEKQLTPTSYVKLEYRYSNYGDARFEYSDGTNTNNFDVNTDRNQVVAGVGFRF